MNILLWIVFGGLTGWIASLIMKTDAQQGILENVVVGIVGAFIGGYLMQLIGEPGVSGFNIRSLVVAVIGAVIFIALYKMIRRKV